MVPYSTIAETDDIQRLATNARWLAMLRWVALVGQLATILTVRFWLDVEVDLAILGAALVVTAVSNASYSAWLVSRGGHAERIVPAQWHAVLGGLALLDLVVLSVMLWATGGPTNPFTVFYFVNVALSAVLLPPRWAWVVCGVAVAAMGVTYYTHRSLAVLMAPQRLQPLSQASEWPLASLGQFVAYATCTAVLVSFLARLTSELAASEARRRRAEELRARSEKLEALGTLAAGAAHELATPLSTIAVVAGEVERDIRNSSNNPSLIADMQLIRGELDRCRAILDRMALDSGQMIGEAPRPVTGSELCAEIVGGLRAADVHRVRVDVSPPEVAVVVPIVATAQALRGLVQNGLDAGDDGPVELVARSAQSVLQIEIVDHGPGMNPDVLDRLGEPFFTTKQPGRGMGLGWFLARSVVERLGGTLAVESQVGQGTKVTVALPTTSDHNKEP
jgi:two-component system sensor histidine kinase RegB